MALFHKNKFPSFVRVIRKVQGKKKRLPCTARQMQRNQTSLISVEKSLFIKHSFVANNFIHKTNILSRHIHLSKELYQNDDTNVEGVNDVIQSWQLNLQKPFGQIISKTSYPLKVAQMNVLEHPAGDKAFVFLQKSNHSLNEEDEICHDGNIQFDDESGEICINGGDSDVLKSQFQWLVHVPPIFDIEVHPSNSKSIIVENLENNRTAITNISGDIFLHKMKSWKVSLHSDEGGITISKFLQGNAKISTWGTKGIITDRLQGQEFSLETKSGVISCKDIYCKSTTITSDEGDIKLGNCHGDYMVATAGNVTIGSLDGSLNLTVSGGGTVTAYLTKPQDVVINTDEGDINLSVATEVENHIELSSPCVEISSEFSLERLVDEKGGKQTVKGYLSSSDSSSSGFIKAHSNKGTITLKTQSWFESLNLK